MTLQNDAMPGPGEPQAVLAPPAFAALFLVVGVHPGAEDDVRDLLADLAGLTRSVAFRAPEDGLSCVTGIGSGLWDRLYGGPRPAGLHPFAALAGPVHTAVSTQGDLLFHLRARRPDLCFELGRHIMSRLAGRAEITDEVHGFRYFDERDMLGFVDGTENPAGAAAVAAVRIGDEDPGFAGGSYVIVQKYLHDLASWDKLPVEEQEKAIGRSKLSDIEMADEVKPPNSHVALNTITGADGNQRQVVRDNMPFGSLAAGEFGTYFIAYAASPDVIEQMLRNMFLGDPPGNYDRILDFSAAVTGSLFFVPTAGFLDDQPAPPAQEASAGGVPPSGDSAEDSAAPGPAGPPIAADGSLGIGSLRDEPPA